MSFQASPEDLEKLAELPHEKQNNGLKALGGLRKLAKSLRTNLKKGLTSEEASSTSRTSVFGTNELPEPPPVSYLSLLWEALTDDTLVILIIAAVVSLVLGIALPPPGEESTSWIEGATILLSVVIISNVSSFVNYQQETAFRALNKTKEGKMVLVRRDGQETSVWIDALRVGDIVICKEGDKIPADGIFISTNGADECRLNTSAMTGENLPVKIDKSRPIMLSGTIVATGDAQILTICTGVRSQWGKMWNEFMEAEVPPTPLQDKLSNLAQLIGYFGLTSGLLVFVVLLIFWVIEQISGTYTVTSCFALPSSSVLVCTTRDLPIEPHYTNLSGLVDYFIIAVTVVVVAVPEGLPLAVTISLGFSMAKMQKDNCLVRRLAACETMGGATNICSDKTGTLTENRMTVTQGWMANKRFETVPVAFKLNDKVKRLVMEGISVNSDAVLSINKGNKSVEESSANKKKPSAKGIEFNGNATECALLVFTMEEGEDYTELRSQGRARQKRKIPFTSQRKRMSVVLEAEEVDRQDGKFIMHTKGASEVIVQRCTHYFNNDGEALEIDDKLRDELNENITGMAKRGLRTIGIAIRFFDNDSEFLPPPISGAIANAEGAVAVDTISRDAELEGGLILLGLTGIHDPIRKEVPDAVDKCKRAGVTVRMVTGDNIETAKHIAEECGIYDPSTRQVALEGPVFAEKTDAEIISLLPRLTVLARSRPNDKSRLVKLLRSQNHVVGVTGDGTNDAPAMKASNVGLSMGIAGTDVAIAASDIVILDDNFASIVSAIRWGRCIYDNIKKFLQFQLTVNVAAVTIALVGALADKGTPLTAVQLLWVNMIMDTLAALALATEPPTDALLERKPYGLDSPVPITSVMFKNIIGQGVWQTFVVLFILFAGPGIMGFEDESREHYTFLFNTFVWLQIWNLINSRKVNDEWNPFDGILSSKLFIIILAGIAIMQFALVELGGEAVKVERLSVLQWLISIGIGATSLVIGGLLKLVPAEKIWEEMEKWAWVRSLLRRAKGEEDEEMAMGDEDSGLVIGGKMISNAEMAEDTEEEEEESDDEEQGTRKGKSKI